MFKRRIQFSDINRKKKLTNKLKNINLNKKYVYISVRLKKIQKIKTTLLNDDPHMLLVSFSILY
jgi:hypothetical protein